MRSPLDTAQPMLCPRPGPRSRAGGFAAWPRAPAGPALDRHLTFADRRLDEAEALVDRDGDPALVAETIAAHTRLLERAGDPPDDDWELASRVEAGRWGGRDRYVAGTPSTER